MRSRVRSSPAPIASLRIAAGRGAGVRARLIALLAHRWLPGGVALLALVITLPALGQGWLADDLIHRWMLGSLGLPELLRGMFSFVHPDPTLNPMGLSLQAGTLPWWTTPGLTISFYRPLAVLSHWADARLWPDSGALMHLHNSVWYAVGCLAASLVFRRIAQVGLSSTAPVAEGREMAVAAGIASLFFALDAVHIGAVAWLANRNVLLSLVFGLLCLLAHDAWRRQGRVWGALVAPVALLASVLSAESGVATGAYLLAYALFLDPWRPLWRMLSLLPGALVGVGWLVAYRAMGYGLSGTSFYLDPTTDMVGFAAAAVVRVPVLLASQWLGQVPAGFNFLALPAARLVWLLAVAVGVGILWLLLPLLRRSATARFWMLGMVLSSILASSIGLLSGRLLMFASLGAMGLMGLYLAPLLGGAGSWTPARSGGRSARWFGAGLLLLHGVLPLLLIPVAVGAMARSQDVIEQVTRLGDIPAEAESVVVVNAPSPFHFIYLPSMRRLDKMDPLPPLRLLAPGHGAVRITRQSDTAFLVRPEGGYRMRPGQPLNPGSLVGTLYLFQQMDTFFWTDRQPLAVGDRVALDGMAVTVTELGPEGRAVAARIDLVAPPEASGSVWLQWNAAAGEYAPFALPPVGTTAIVGGLPGP